MDRNIETYLRELRDAMASAGADPALAQDALFDAEEHLQAEMAAGGEFALVAQVYGSPEEVAAAYLGTAPVHDMAAAMAGPYPNATAPPPAGMADTADAAEGYAVPPAGGEPSAGAPPQGVPEAPAAPGETFVATEMSAGWIEAGGATAGRQAPADVVEPGASPVEQAASTAVPEPAAGTGAGRVFCVRCGTEGRAGQGFCRRCGAPLPAPVVGQPPASAQPHYSGLPYGAPPRGQYPVGVQTGMAAAEAARTQAPHSVWRDIFGPFVDSRTWTSLVYMILSLGLGIVYFNVVVVGLSTSIPLVFVFGAGIPLVVLVLAIVRALSLFESRVVEVLLGTRMPRRWRPLPPNTGFFKRIEFWLTDERTWLSMFYMVMMLPLGIVYFTIAVTLLATSVALIASPIWAWFGEYTFTTHDVMYTGDFPRFLIPLAFIVGLLLLVGTMHAIKWIGRGHAAFAKAMLVRLK